ncbi:MAG: DUF1361 domain-containing protein [Bacteroidetes bacterium]|nr:DUF1361 domain-containing protein [Bacteroidota bacterium]
MSKKFIAFLVFIALLCFARPFFVAGKSPYLFLLWNLFLAALPYFFVKWRPQSFENGFWPWIRMAFWLLFLPNAPYIITDLVHLDHSNGFEWYDTVLILSAGIAGIKFAFDSLDIILKELKAKFPFIASWIWNAFFLGLSAYGVYLGRYLRFNSWDVLANPRSLVVECLQLFVHPFQHQHQWAMIGVFSVFLFMLRLIWPPENLRDI